MLRSTAIKEKEEHQKKVLIVENEVIIADDVCRIVSESGYCPLEPVFSYDEAIKSFQTDEPDLVIIDIKLQGKKSGIDLAHFIKDAGKVPIIYLTVYNDLAMFNKAAQTSPVAFHVKPFVDIELLHSIQVSLS